VSQRKLTIPVSPETYDLLQQLAYEQGQSLAAFCRDRIMARERLEEAFAVLQKTLLAAIHDAVTHQQNSEHKGDDHASSHAMIAEILLLLRSMSTPQKMQPIHGELKRIGLEPFTSI